jgi:hypothetical protein
MAMEYITPSDIEQLSVGLGIAIGFVVMAGNCAGYMLARAALENDDDLVRLKRISDRNDGLLKKTVFFYGVERAIKRYETNPGRR